MGEQKNVVIQLGSNIGHRKRNLSIAIHKIKRIIGSVIKLSNIYETAPWGNRNQKSFYNQIAIVECSAPPVDILKHCQLIEKELGPGKVSHWGARIIDLDILFIDQEIFKSDYLTIPHPRLHERRFVLEPLNEILPNFIHPVLKKDIKTLLGETKDSLDVKCLNSIEEDFPKKYQFMAIEGNIGAGKTTFSQMLAAKFDARLILEEFSDNPFLPFFYKEPERFAFPVELFFMTERHKQLESQLIQQSMFSDGVIADYFFFKTLLFAGNNLSQEELRLFHRLFKILNGSFPQPDLLVYLHRPVNILLRQLKSVEDHTNRIFLRNILLVFKIRI